MIECWYTVANHISEMQNATLINMLSWIIIHLLSALLDQLEKLSSLKYCCHTAGIYRTISWMFYELITQIS